MEAKDLMIGDKVGVRSNDGCDLHVMTVSEVKSEGISSGKHLVFFAYDEIEPIPLTAEIILKSGIKRAGYDRYFVGNNKYIKYYEHNDTFAIGLMIDAYDEPQFQSFASVNFCHELQHALRLVGLNELADNLKVE